MSYVADFNKKVDYLYKLNSEEQINEVIKDLHERREKHLGYLDELESTGETQKLLTDSDARRTYSKDTALSLLLLNFLYSTIFLYG